MIRGNKLYARLNPVHRKFSLTHTNPNPSRGSLLSDAFVLSARQSECVCVMLRDDISAVKRDALPL